MVLQLRSVGVLFCGFVFSPFTSYRSKSGRPSVMRCPARARPPLQPHGFELLPAPACHPSWSLLPPLWGSQAKPLEVGSREKQSFTHLAHQEADLQVCTWHNFKVLSLGRPQSPLSGLVLHWPGFLPGVKEGLRKPFPKRLNISLLLHSMQGCFSLTQAIPSLFTFS